MEKSFPYSLKKNFKFSCFLPFISVRTFEKSFINLGNLNIYTKLEFYDKINNLLVFFASIKGYFKILRLVV